MIKFHPNHQMLTQFAEGQLPGSLAIAVSIHIEMCPQCQKQVQGLTYDAANLSFDLDEQNDVMEVMDDFEQMFEHIVSDDQVAHSPMQKQLQIKVKDQSFELPRALHNVPMSNWLNLGKLSRSSLDLDEGKIHSHLLHIGAGGEVPCHTHKGFELTLILDGSFEDEMGRYEKGDFILLDNQHNHQPKTENGCLCYTVADDALHFTQGIHRLFNPISNLIY